MITLDIILPSYKPSGAWIERLLNNIDRIKAHFSSYDLDIHLIICTDGSWDYYSNDDKEALTHLSQTINVIILKDDPNRGKGYAVRTGAASSHADYMLYTDYDIPFETEVYINILKKLINEQYDVVTAERGHFYQSKLPYFRVILSKGSLLMNKIFLNLPVQDTQAGLKAFNSKGREALMATNINSFLFDTQFIAIATRRRLKVSSVKAKVRDDLELSGMSWKVMVRELRMFIKVFRSRWF